MNISEFDFKHLELLSQKGSFEILGFFSTLQVYCPGNECRPFILITTIARYYIFFYIIIHAMILQRIKIIVEGYYVTVERREWNGDWMQGRGGSVFTWIQYILLQSEREKTVEEKGNKK